MKNIVGTPARGNNFFQRQSQIQRILSRLHDGNNLHIAAPRRVGKTSILFYLSDNSINDFIYVYIDTESINNEQEFYKKLLKEILKNDTIAKSRKLKKLLEEGAKLLKKVKSVQVFSHRIDFNEEADNPDYYEELTNFLSAFETENNKKLILLIDEFPQTILNIVASNKGDTEQALYFLQSNRELRLNPDVNNRVQFIYTGSIGLNHTVATINATAFVNDLNSIEIEPLSMSEAKLLVQELFADKAIEIHDDVINHLLHTIDWLIPFHIQLAVQEISSVCLSRKMATVEDVNTAFSNMITLRNNNHFEHYYSRLKSQLKRESCLYAEAILKIVADKGIVTKAELYNEAVGMNLQDNYRQIVELLVYDGYINNNQNPFNYRFNSPILRMWWQKFIL